MSFDAGVVGFRWCRGCERPPTNAHYAHSFCCASTLAASFVAAGQAGSRRLYDYYIHSFVIDRLSATCQGNCLGHMLQTQLVFCLHLDCRLLMFSQRNAVFTVI